MGATVPRYSPPYIIKPSAPHITRLDFCISFAAKRVVSSNVMITFGFNNSSTAF